MGSSTEARQSPGSTLPDTAVREQLQRVLASSTFSRSERLSSFLRFAVEETLAGRGHSLKEQVLAVALYGRRPGSVTFDDSAVRADARRLRDKLREYYADVLNDRVIISLPKGSYTPVFDWAPSASTTQPEPAQAPPPSERRIRIACAVAGMFAVAVLVGWWMLSRRLPPQQVRPLTTYPGEENEPSLSPDGNFVAFSWSGSAEPGPKDIWIRSTTSEALRRLTDTAVGEFMPAWSPDGKEIAFTRQQQGVFIVSHLGGPERRICEMCRNPKWTPDGRSLVVLDFAKPRSPAAVFQIDLESLARKQLTVPASGNGDWQFEVSPDGSMLAFSRAERSGVVDIYTVPMAGGTPRRLTNWAAPMYGMAWTPDGRDIVYAVAGQSLWRISATATSPGSGTQLSGFEGMVTPMALPFQPTISRPRRGEGARLVFETRSAHISLQSMELDGTAGGELTSRSVLQGTRVDVPGTISPDGQKLAFRSYSTAGWRLWVVDRDGSDLHQLPAVPAYMTEMGSWSPDGRHVVFDAAVDGNSDIYVVAEHGGVPRRLTSEPSVEVRARWSRDWRWIYYSSNRTGRYEIWRMPATGGSSAQITRGGGFEPMESMDGRSIYYLHQPPLEGIISTGRAELKVVPVNGGEEKTLLPVVYAQTWGVTARGVAFLSFEKDEDTLNLYSVPGGHVSRIGRLPFRLNRRGFGRLTFSADGRWAVGSRQDRAESDLTLVDNFR